MPGVHARGRRASMRTLLLFALVSLSPLSTHAVVLCAKPKADGSFNTTVMIRAACKPRETQLDPAALGLQGPRGPRGAQGERGEQGQPGVCDCSASTTSSTSTTTSETLVPCSTTSTLGVPGCGDSLRPPFCALQLCFSGQTCTDLGNGHCGCTGPVLCGGQFSICGGECPAGQSCTPLAVPDGCPSIGCTCE